MMKKAAINLTLGNHQEQTPKNDPLYSRKRVLHLSADRPEHHLVEVAQQICFHNDHSPLSEDEALEWLKNPVARHACHAALAYYPIQKV